MRVEKGLIFCVLFTLLYQDATSNEAARRLFDDLLSNYNKLVRPIKNHTQAVRVRIRLKLSQLLDVHEKEQIMKTNVWLRQEWHDYKLMWNPDEYDGIDMLYIPSSALWTPDIVLYNTADGNYQITIMTKATVYWDGWVVWEPPAVYHSMCEMDVKWFPFDEQECKMKFGAWSNDGFQVDLIHYDDHESVKEFVNELGQQVWRVEDSVDLSGYHPHVEWDILAAPGERHFIRYPCCEAPFVDVTYYFVLRRKTLFYTVNLIIPCIGISCLTVFVFYLPADSGEKIVMCISILISLNALFLLLVEIIPSTSIVMPLIVRYLLFTMILVTVSVAATVVTLGIHYRGPSTHRMPAWIKKLFMYVLPPLLGMQRPTWTINAREDGKDGARMRNKKKADQDGTEESNLIISHCTDQNCTGSTVRIQLPISGSLSPGISSRLRGAHSGPISNYHTFPAISASRVRDGTPGEEADVAVDAWERRDSLRDLLNTRDESRKCMLENGDQLSAVRYVASCIQLIAHKIRREAKEKEIVESWSFVAMVIDRLFLYIFALACVVGTCGIIFQAPSLYDTRRPIG